MNKCFQVQGHSNIHEITTHPQQFTVQGQARPNLYIIGSKQPHH